MPLYFVSPAAADVRQDASIPTVVLNAQAVAGKAGATLSYSLGVSAACKSKYMVVRGTFAYYGDASRANCMFWATPIENV